MLNLPRDMYKRHTTQAARKRVAVHLVKSQVNRALACIYSECAFYSACEHVSSIGQHNLLNGRAGGSRALDHPLLCAHQANEGANDTDQRWAALQCLRDTYAGAGSILGPAQQAVPHVQRPGTHSSNMPPELTKQGLWEGIQRLFRAYGYGADGSDVYFSDLGEQGQEVVIDVLGELLKVDETAKHLLALQQYMSQEAHAEFMLRVMKGR